MIRLMRARIGTDTGAYSDYTMVTAQTGAPIEVLKMCDLEQCGQAVSEAEIAERLKITVPAGLDRLGAGGSGIPLVEVC